jgi:hypothetical protein
MDYVREHIKRYWGMTYRRTLGVSLVTFSVAMGIGLTFTILTHSLAVTNYLNYLIFWVILMLAVLLVALSNLFASHTSSVRYMHDLEHSTHSKYMAIWMISLVIGTTLFFLPLLFSNAYTEPVMLLFALGGVFLVLYGTISIIFKHRYGELAIGGVAFWIMFAFSMLELGNSQLNIATRSSLSLYVAAMSITIITGFVGLAMLFNSTKEATREFVNVVERIERDDIKIRSRKAGSRRA